MSYWVALEMPTAEYVREKHDVTIGDFCWNYTSNVSRMWRTAGCDLYALKDRKAGDLVPYLERAIWAMRDYPERYRAMEPDNGWGTYEGCLEFLEKILQGCYAVPSAIVRVSA